MMQKNKNSNTYIKATITEFINFVEEMELLDLLAINNYYEAFLC